MKTNRIDVGPGAEAAYTERSAVNPMLPYDGFNACHYTHDTPLHVAQCRHELALHLKVNPQALVIPVQTHSDRVATIGSAYTAEDITGVDSLVTATPGVVLCINTADCVPVLFNDPCARVIGLCHAGWRGVVNGVVENTLGAMCNLGADPSRIHAAMAPCICTSCFEVGHEVASQFAKWHGAVQQSSLRAKPHIDLAAAITAILRSRGVASVTPPPECTRCNWHRMFSARRMGIDSGRMLTYLRLT